jgi:hypothetical protein
MNTLRFVAFIPAMMVLVACAQGPTHEEMSKAGLEPMRPSEVKAFVANRTFSGVYEEDTTWTIYHDSVGNMRGSATWSGTWSGGSDTDKGRWSVAEDGRICRTWDEWLEDQEECWLLYNDGSKVNLVRVSGKAGSQTSDSFTVREGNPDNL